VYEKYIAISRKGIEALRTNRGIEPLVYQRLAIYTRGNIKVMVVA
jgi:hypothetical protein